MSKTALSLAAAVVIMAAFDLTGQVKACDAPPRTTSLCTAPHSTEIRDEPNGRVEYVVSGKVLVAGWTGNGLWAHVEVPCAGYKGWIASRDLTCEGVTASVQESPKP